MCPSFMATGDEDKSTRARANVLREFLNGDGDPWNHREIYEILDLCLDAKDVNLNALQVLILQRSNRNIFSTGMTDMEHL